MVIDDLILCSLQGFLHSYSFSPFVASGIGTTEIPSRSSLLNAHVAQIFRPSLLSENILMSISAIY
jgi:hypothetical protein